MVQKETGLYIDAGLLVNFARNTAATLERDGYVRGRTVARECSRALASLKSKADALTGAVPEAQEAAEWFSDNWYMAEREGKDGMSRLVYAGKLPACGRGAVVSELASALVRSGRGEVTEERLRIFLTEVQRTAAITEKELAVLTPVLKMELVIFLDGVTPRSFTAFNGDAAELALLMKNVFTSLRFLAGADLSGILEDCDPMEQTLRRDPAGIYCLMDDETRRYYRRTLARLAKREGVTEEEAARLVLRLAENGPDRHVGTYILQSPFGREEKGPSGGWYIALGLALPVLLAVLIGILTRSVTAALLLVLPVSETARNVTDFICLRVKRPERLPRLALERGVPKSGRTICVISALLTREDSGEGFARLLEEYRLANRDCGENLIFGVLADLRESRFRDAREDEAVIENARRAVERRNREYGGGFYLFIRDREYNERDGVYMARERKRGAITELVRLLSGDKSTLRVLAGDKSALEDTNFILTLDADTRLTAGSARELIGAALHPLNVPVIDAARGRVTRGFGILQPRVVTDLKAASKSDFSRIFAGGGGIDPYSTVVSNVYQDLFGEGTFMGKGLINVPVYRRVMEGAIPDNAVLSHDILEGAYLRCGYMSDTELTDGFPHRVTAFFARQERWIRGDWQNARWLLPRLRRADGTRVKNTLGALDRWKLFDNLRHSLVPAGVLLSLLVGMLFPGAGLLAAFLAAILAEASGLLLTSAEILIKHDGSSRARYQSVVISGLAGAIMQTAIRLMLLPAEGVISLFAVCRAVYRMTVTKRGLLAWVTSAEAERGGETIRGTYRSLRACPILGAAVMLLTPYPSAAAVGLIWIFAPAYAWALSRPVVRERFISGPDRSFLLSCAGDIWRYFRDNLTEENNYLPPDNVQTEPHLGPARRTSPTNIGLAMLSALAAADLGFVSFDEASALIKRTLVTVARLEKWNGHLYNWYDTATLAPLEPRTVSTVDSGNLAGCLITVRQAFIEKGDKKAAGACERLIDDMDFRPLFDSRRKLFFIGWDAAKDAPSEGVYDLLASEARATSFIAIALGHAPRKHWRRLGRALVSLDSYSGMASWTGTMFEYLMPNLILPCCHDSLIYESSRFAVYAQKRAHRGVPWGISESAFYAFDPGLSYRYKAHGAEKLAFKRHMGQEVVVSPYSTFLALPVDVKGSLRNLRRLRAMGMAGKYGYYEAADFTPSRTAGAKFRVVRTFMAHHLGMSIVAIANTLCDDVFPKRFMSDVRMAAYAELLEERVPTGAVVLRQPAREVPEKPRRQEDFAVTETVKRVDALAPKAVPLYNGVYGVLVTETGKTRSRWRDIELTRFDEEPSGRAGTTVYLRVGDKLTPLAAAPHYQRDARYSAQLTDGAARLMVKSGAWEASVTVTVPPSDAGECWYVEASGLPDGEAAELLIAFEPALARRADFDAHPAFLKLSLSAEMRGGTLVIKRRGRGDEPAMFAAVCASANMTCRTERERGEPLTSGRFSGTSPDMRIVCSVPLDTKNGRAAASFAMAASLDENEAVETSKRLAVRRGAEGLSRLAASALKLTMSAAEAREAVGYITPLIFTAPGRAEPNVDMRRELLWKFGVSGDLPIIAAKIRGASELPEAEKLVRRHALLAENGVRSDLVFLITDAGDYRSAQRGAVTDTLRRIGREGTFGIPGGVFAVDASDHDSASVIAHARLVRDLAEPWSAPARQEEPPPEEAPLIAGGAVAIGMDEDGAFRFAMDGSLPPAAWSHVLTNGRFGWLATESGTGYMWFDNARRMKINRWLNDPLTSRGTERLSIVRDGEKASLFADGTGRAAVEYGFGYAVWKKEALGVRATVTAFVPEAAAARVLIIELSGDLAGVSVDWSTELIMGEANAARPEIVTWEENGVLCARDPSGEYRDTVFRMASSARPVAFTMERDGVLTGQYTGKTGSGSFPAAAMRVEADARVILAAGCEDAETLRELCCFEAASDGLSRTRELWRRRAGAVRIETPFEDIDRFAGGWAVYQTWACRLLARTALYQNGGAIGFRDQLQDAAALALVDPELLISQIRLCARHQYQEGDVQHWWHPGPDGDRGVRTRCADDLLWLPWAVAEAVERTGCHAILRETAPWLASPPLKSDERDRYEYARWTEEGSTILAHAMRAADLFIERGTGPHGLALFLGGDWNDGMDAVGKNGVGESVWLTWFGSIVLRRLSGICASCGEDEAAARYLSFADGLLRAGEGSWSGEWYLRGFYDSGAPLGAPGNGECEIDAIAQAFAVFAGADKKRCKIALDAAYDRLFDRENRVVKLFTPAFDGGADDPGYIRSYCPGYRENGGQYTHGAVWLAMAYLRLGDTERGEELLEALSPWGRDLQKYKTEPYAIAADVYSAAGHEGRGGWTWYTGSAGWYFRAVTEELLGLRLSGGRLFVDANRATPFRARLLDADAELEIERNGSVTINGERPPRDGYPMKNFKEYVAFAESM